MEVSLFSMAQFYLFLINDDLQVQFLSLWLDACSLATLDVAVTNHRLRPSWMTLLLSVRSTAIDNWSHNYSSLMWISRRGIQVSQMHMKVDADGWRVRRNDL